MRDSYGRCDDFSCPCRTEFGYCSLSACLKHSSNISDLKSSTEGYVEVGPMLNMTDHGIEQYIKIYLKDHTLEDLVKIVAKIVNGD